MRDGIAKHSSNYRLHIFINVEKGKGQLITASAAVTTWHPVTLGLSPKSNVQAVLF